MSDQNEDCMANGNSCGEMDTEESMDEVREGMQQGLNENTSSTEGSQKGQGDSDNESFNRHLVRYGRKTGNAKVVYQLPEEISIGGAINETEGYQQGPRDSDEESSSVPQDDVVNGPLLQYYRNAGNTEVVRHLPEEINIRGAINNRATAGPPERNLERGSLVWLCKHPVFCANMDYLVTVADPQIGQPNVSFRWQDRDTMTPLQVERQYIVHILDVVETPRPSPGSPNRRGRSGRRSS
jgi:hypothetical protein